MSDVNLDDCNCCEGLRTQTPAEIFNPAGLPAISYRVGTYNQFKQSMLAKLSAAGQPALSGLKTRSTDDFSIALLDSWAVVCDVLTFYQERIANESYTRTASEYLSLLQLARSASYELRPGVAADTYLAFTLENTPGSPGKAIIDIGTKAQSLPNPGESPQVFETVEAIEARSAWNAIVPRKTRSQPLSTGMPSLQLQGISANLHAGDALLIIASGTSKALRFIQNVVVDTVAQQTTVFLEDAILTDIPPVNGSGEKQDLSPSNPPVPSVSGNGADGSGGQPPTAKTAVPVVSGDGSGGQKQLAAVSPVVTASPAAPSSNGASARPSTFSYTAPQALNNSTVDTVLRGQVWNERDLSAYATVQKWSLQDVLASAAAPSQNGAAPEDVTGVYALRVHASLFGNNAPDWQALPDAARTPYYKRYQQLNPNDKTAMSDFTDWPFLPTTSPIIVAGSTAPVPQPQNVLDLDRSYPQIPGKSWVAVVHPGGSVNIARVDSTAETSLVNYTLSGKVTRLKLATTEQASPATMTDIRQITVYGQSEKLSLAQLPIGVPVQNKSIDVPGLYHGLQPGKTILIAGELADLDGVQTSEVAVLAGTTFDASYPGGLTTLTLKDNLANTYKPETVTVYANIARATQGETVRDELLGNGDTSQAYQRFTLRQGPLTYLHNATTGGIVSTLQVYVNDIQWQEVPTLLGHGPRDRVFVTRTGADGKTTIQFGDGQSGARLPNGQENVRATYRKGSGTSGHVTANQITQLMTRPLGVKSVSNPQAPLGAEDPETAGDARSNAALTVLTLNRVVSVADYENFARSFPGVAKVLATLIATSRLRGMFVTLAGTGGAEIAQDDPLYIRIFFAMQKAGDPTITLRLQSYRKALFRIGARIKVEPDFAEADVLQRVQTTVRSYFSFENRSFGQAVTLKEVINVIQDVPGVVTAGVYHLYRLEDTPALNTTLVAAIPTVGSHGEVSAAELLIADTVPFDALEVIP